MLYTSMVSLGRTDQCRTDWHATFSELLIALSLSAAALVKSAGEARDGAAQAIDGFNWKKGAIGTR